jgi:predicted nucleic acid-binding protein
MMPVLLDTGPIVALLDKSQQDHDQCVELLSTLEAPLATCEAVIAEACHLLRKLAGASAHVLQNVESGNFLIPYRVTGRAARLTKLMTRYANVPMDFADACLVDLASELGSGRILTLDNDFRIYRWGRNRPFELALNLR